MDEKAVVTRSLPIPDAYVGCVIGKGGCNIKRIKEKNNLSVCFIEEPKGESIWHHLRMKGSSGDIYCATRMAMAAICFTE